VGKSPDGALAGEGKLSDITCFHPERESLKEIVKKTVFGELTRLGMLTLN
jgi:hypothetical protein